MSETNTSSGKPKASKPKTITQLAAEIAKIDSQLAALRKKAAQQSVKAEMEVRKRHLRRRYLPDFYPEYPEIAQATSLLADAVAETVKGTAGDSGHAVLATNEMYQGFRRCNRPVYDQVIQALQGDSFNKVFDALAAMFDCDKAQVCVLHSRTITRKNRALSVTYVRFTYNPPVNDILTATTEARFDGSMKSWNVVMDEVTTDIFRQNLRHYFSVVIDVSTMVILRNESEPALAMPSRPAFLVMPFHVRVGLADIEKAINAARPGDAPVERRMHVNDGVQGFVKFPPQDLIWTRAPFLLVRYAVLDGAPRYASFSTLAMAIEDISFGNGAKATSMAIARFMDASRASKQPAFEVVKIVAEVLADCDGAGASSSIKPEDLIVKTPELTQILLGDFGRFAEVIASITDAMHDLHIAPLCSDYVTLVKPNYGADTEAAGIIAYVLPGTRSDRGARGNQFLRAITSYFGYDPTAYPVVFSRPAMEATSDDDFLLTCLHELAHWLVMEQVEGEESIPEIRLLDDCPHGLAWAVCLDLLVYAVTGTFKETSLKNYHPSETEIIDLIEKSVFEVGIIEIIKVQEYLSKYEFRNIIRKCMNQIELSSETAIV